MVKSGTERNISQATSLASILISKIQGSKVRIDSIAMLPEDNSSQLLPVSEAKLGDLIRKYPGKERVTCFAGNNVSFLGTHLLVKPEAQM